MIITAVGNVVADPELRFTPSGAAVANFSIAVTKRTFDKNRNEWVDGDTSFVNCQAWRQMAENVAESLTKGTRVVVTGDFAARSYETREGEKRTVWELTADDVGPSLKFATARPQRTQGQATGGQRHQTSRQAAPAPSGDPWSGGQAAATGQTQDPWAGTTDPWGPR